MPSDAHEDGFSNIWFSISTSDWKSDICRPWPEILQIHLIEPKAFPISGITDEGAVLEAKGLLNWFIKYDGRFIDCERYFIIDSKNLKELTHEYHRCTWTSNTKSLSFLRRYLDQPGVHLILNPATDNIARIIDDWSRSDGKMVIWKSECQK